MDKSFEGILGLRLEHISTGSDFIVYACYPPPENSTRGRDAQSLFAHLLTQIYVHSDCADFNERMGPLSDTIWHCDTIPPRKIFDNTRNRYGQELIDFLNESKCCVLNGRYNCDNTTSISCRGRAVVDYLCVPHETLAKCCDFKVLTVQEIAADNNLLGLLGQRSRVSDHSALVTEFKCTDYDMNS